MSEIEKPLKLTTRGKRLIVGIASVAAFGGGVVYGEGISQSDKPSTLSQLNKMPKAQITVPAETGADAIVAKKEPNLRDDDEGEFDKVRRYVQQQGIDTSGVSPVLHSGQVVSVPLIPGEYITPGN